MLFITFWKDLDSGSYRHLSICRNAMLFHSYLRQQSYWIGDFILFDVLVFLSSLFQGILRYKSYQSNFKIQKNSLDVQNVLYSKKKQKKPSSPQYIL